MLPLQAYCSPASYNRYWPPNLGSCEKHSILKLCFCSSFPAVECPPVPPPLHGFSTPPDCSPGSYQTGCWFSCEEGYQLAGSYPVSDKKKHKPCPLVPNGQSHSYSQLTTFSYLKRFRQTIHSVSTAFILHPFTTCIGIRACPAGGREKGGGHT